MDQLKKAIIAKIEQYDNIALFFHELPDFDALGSVFGFQAFLEAKYPKKDIRIIGLDTLDNDFENELFTLNKNHVPNQFLVKALGVVLDTANSVRIWSQRQNFCPELVCIDHHPVIEPIGDIEWKDPSYSATAEMIAELVLEWDENKVKEQTCNYLYAGLLTDTNRFLYPSTSTHVYSIVEQLIKHGLDRQLVHDVVYLTDFKVLRFKNYLFNLANFEQKLGLAWVRIPKGSFARYGVKKMSYVNTLAGIKNIKIWASFYYDEDAKKWKGSLRSAKLPINQIATKYCGGGHPLASGMTLDKQSLINYVIKDIRKYLKNQR